MTYISILVWTWPYTGFCTNVCKVAFLVILLKICGLIFDYQVSSTLLIWSYQVGKIKFELLINLKNHKQSQNLTKRLTDWLIDCMIFQRLVMKTKTKINEVKNIVQYLPALPAVVQPKFGSCVWSVTKNLSRSM